MASLTPSILPRDPHHQIFLVGATLVLLVGLVFAATFRPAKKEHGQDPSALSSFLRFFYASFLKPHTGDGTGGQQDALESFYKAQASVYDTTRRRLLRGREDMLGLVAAQLATKAANERVQHPKRIWVDVSRAVIREELTTNHQRLTGRWRYRLEHRGHVRICRRGEILLHGLSCRFLSLAMRSRAQTICSSRLEECESHLRGCEDFLPSGL